MALVLILLEMIDLLRESPISPLLFVWGISWTVDIDRYNNSFSIGTYSARILVLIHWYDWRKGVEEADAIRLYSFLDPRGLPVVLLLLLLLWSFQHTINFLNLGEKMPICILGCYSEASRIARVEIDMLKWANSKIYRHGAWWFKFPTPQSWFTELWSVCSFCILFSGPLFLSHL